MNIRNKTTYLYENETFNFGSQVIFIRGILTILLRAGFILVQICCIPINNVQQIIFHNILDITCSTISFMFIGYILAFGYDSGGVIGSGIWIGSGRADLDNAIIGWTSTITATAIFTTVVAGRMHHVGFIILVFIFSGFIQPMFIHWIWTTSGWMYNSTFMSNEVSYKDQAGGFVIHTMAGVLALCAGSILGRRILFVQEIDESSIPPDSPGSVIIAYLLQIVGLIGLCVPSPFYKEKPFSTNYLEYVILNNVLAAAGGIMSVTILQSLVHIHNDMFNYWIMIRNMQGAIAGIVTIAPGVDIYNPLVAFLISIAGGIIFYFGAEIMFSSVMEDYANIIPIHFICGFIGIFLPPIGIIRRLEMNENSSTVANFTWQIICTFIMLVTIIIFALSVLFFFDFLGILRNRSEKRNHQRALRILKNMPKRSFWQKIFSGSENELHLQPGNRTKQENKMNEEIKEFPTEPSEKTSEPTVVLVKNMNKQQANEIE